MSENPGFTFCICPDGQLIKEYIATLLQQSPSPQNIAWESSVWWGDEELNSDFWEKLTIQGLFPKPSALIVRRANILPAATWKRLSAALAQPSTHRWLFLCMEVAWEKGQPKLPAHITKLRCLEFATSKDWVWRSPGLDARSLKSFVIKRAETLSLHFERDALERFCATLPLDAATVENELQKLSLLASDGKITSSMIHTASAALDYTIFSFIRHIQSGDISKVWKQLRQGLDEDDTMLFPFLGLLTREARTLQMLLAGEKPWIHPSEAAQKQALAQKLGHTGLAHLFESILQAEYHVKSGERSPEQSLEALIANLRHLFSAPRA